MAMIALAGVTNTILEINEGVELENYSLRINLENWKHDAGYIGLSLQECNSERFEWRKYFGGEYGLERAREYYNAPAIDWEEIATSTAQ